MNLPPRPSWADAAACRHVDRATRDAFFHDEKDPDNPARRICAGCSVRTQCLDHAITTGEPHGIWGGKDEEERKRIARSRSRRRPERVAS